MTSTAIPLQPIKHYQNNPRLKAAGQGFSFTIEQAAEYYKCSQDPIYFINNYVKIITLDHGLQPFKLWDFQADLVGSFISNRFTIAKFPRQVGKTSTTTGFLLWTLLFVPDKTIGIYANKGKVAVGILSRLKLSYEYVPIWMQQGIVEWNKMSIELENRSKVNADSTSESSGRSGSQDIVLMDEFAIVPENIANEFYASAYPTITSGTQSKLIILSTPKGMNHFQKMWDGAIKGTNDFVPKSVHWSDVPGRNQAWADSIIKQFGQKYFDQEFGCVTGDTILEVLNTETGEIESLSMLELNMRLKNENS